MADVLHINDVPFLTSISNHLHYVTVNTIDNIKVPTLEASLKNIIKSYAVQGLSAGIIFLDMEFKCMKDRNLLGVNTGMVSRGEHMK